MRGHLVCKVNSTAGRSILTKVSGVNQPATETEPEEFQPDQQDYLILIWGDSNILLTPFEFGYFQDECFEIVMEDGVFEPENPPKDDTSFQEITDDPMEDYGRTGESGDPFWFQDN